MVNKKNKHVTYDCAEQLMPANESAKEVLDTRAEMLAHVSETESEKENTIDYIRFVLGESQYYGIPFVDTKEVIRQTVITPMPYVPDFVTGVINHRGLLLTIVNLGKYFNLTETLDKKDASSEIIISSNDTHLIGLQVTDILGSDTYQNGQLDASLSHASTIRPEYISGLHQGKTAILNIDLILQDIHQKLNSAQHKEIVQ